MGNQIIQKSLKSYFKDKVLYSAQLSLISNRRTNQLVSTNSGFSMVEMVAVVLMVGILAAIAVPTWVAFLSRQSLNKANDAVLSVIQDAQQKAKSTKQSYSVSFQTTSSNILQSAVYPTSAATSNTSTAAPYGFWQTLGGTLDIPPGSIILGSNITGQNTATSTSTTYRQAYSSTGNQTTITFNNLGALPNGVSLPTDSTTGSKDSGFKIVVAAPIGNSNSPSAVKRCVVINTLLATMITLKDADCGS